ncbi:MAG: MOSC domain-containing protein [Candidatus Obscuribacterales bacterium]|nr:MOSC domain-containing protein [Candidatus Obscuribacterales bacterium]
MPRPETPFRIKALNIYPVKSCAGIASETVSVSARGLLYDRSFMIVDKEGIFLTQRKLPRMSLIQVDIDELDSKTKLKLSAPDKESILIDISSETPDIAPIEVTVWRDKCLAYDSGEEASAWLSEFLQRDCRLVKMADIENRPVHATNGIIEKSTVGFADAFPFLVISDASLAALNEKLPEPMSMNRFRPSIVISGCEPFSEDSWKTISIKDIVLDLIEPCARCTITTIEQETARRGQEPLKTLSTFRQKDNQILFGMYACHRNPGILNLGDPVLVLK